MNYHRRNFKYNTTTFDERHKRVSLVLIATTGLTGLFGAVYGMMKKIFNSDYLTKNNQLTIGSEHIFASMLLTSVLAIIISGLCYCYSEYLTFYKEEPNEQRIKNEIADRCYKFWLDFLQISVVLPFFWVCILSPILFSLPVIWYIRIAIIVFLMIFCYLLKWQTINTIVKELFKGHRPNLAEKIFAGGIYSFVCFFICLGFGLSLLGSGLEKKLTVNFHNENPMPMEIIVINKNPVDVKIQVANSKFSKHSLPLKKGFDSIVFEPPISLDKTQYSIGGKKVDISKSYREYRKVVNLFGQLTEGKNEIELTIITNDKYKYVLTNQVYVTKGRAEFVKQSFSTKL